MRSDGNFDLLRTLPDQETERATLLLGRTGRGVRNLGARRDVAAGFGGEGGAGASPSLTWVGVALPASWVQLPDGP